jgi:hypothetical protein
MKFENNDNAARIAEEKKNLVTFVKTHILIMLRKLYVKIGEEEKALNDCVIKNYAKIITEASELPKRGEKKRTIELERYWFKLLYSGNGYDVNSKQQNDLRIVGPVGERPLHVCALSTARFGHVDFEGTGSYVSEGIVEGMMEYIKTLAPPGAGSDQIEGNEGAGCWGEAAAQYGKDYCAAVGSLNVDWDSYRHGDKDGLLPPFWRQINEWKKAHLLQRGLGSTPQRFARTLVTTGIYEGETILFPLIAGKNEKALRQLLDQKKEPRCLACSPLPLPPYPPPHPPHPLCPFLSLSLTLPLALSLFLFLSLILHSPNSLFTLFADNRSG